jgi:hypothetical protein
VVPGGKKRRKKTTDSYFSKRAITGQNRSLCSVTWNWTALISNSPKWRLSFSSVQFSPVQSSPDGNYHGVMFSQVALKLWMYRPTTNIQTHLTSMVSHGDTRPDTLPLEGGEFLFVVIATTLLLPGGCYLSVLCFLFTTYLPTY